MLASAAVTAQLTRDPWLLGWAVALRLLSMMPSCSVCSAPSVDFIDLLLLHIEYLITI